MPERQPKTGASPTASASSSKLPLSRDHFAVIPDLAKRIDAAPTVIGPTGAASAPAFTRADDLALRLDLDDLELDIGVALAIRRGGGVREDRNSPRHRRRRAHDPGRWRCRLAGHRIDDQFLELNDEMLAVGQEAATLGYAAQ